jgi:hypothetical protein
MKGTIFSPFDSAPVGLQSPRSSHILCPTFIAQNMPWAGCLVAANHVNGNFHSAMNRKSCFCLDSFSFYGLKTHQLDPLTRLK